MNIANKLTTLRVFLIPVFIILVLFGHEWGVYTLLGTTIPVHLFWAGVVFTFASFTDFLDGYLARKLKLVTAFGEFFDPMADKLIVIAAFILLVELNVVPGWIVIVIVSRELLVTGLRVLLARQNGKVLAAALPGKIKTTSQMLSIIFYLFNNVGFSYFGIPFAEIMLYICLFFTVYSGIEYFYQGRFVFNDKI